MSQPKIAEVASFQVTLIVRRFDPENRHRAKVG